MKTTILILLITSTTISAQKISQETYNGLVSRQYKYVPESKPLFVIIGNERQDISTAGWDWPSNSSYNQYYWSLYLRHNWRHYDLLYDQAQSYRRIYAPIERQRLYSLESKQRRRNKP